MSPKFPEIYMRWEIVTIIKIMHLLVVNNREYVRGLLIGQLVI